MLAMRDSSKEPRTPILELAKKKRFSLIQALLLNKRDAALSSWLEDCSLSKTDTNLHSFAGQTVLHMIMAYRPPVQVVDLLIQKMSNKRPGTVPEDVTDIQGKTPLHSAVLHGCDAAVVQRLMNGVVSGVPAVTKDSRHRLPLHWACLYSSTNQRLGCNGRSKSDLNMIEIVESLVRVYPHAVFVKDEDGKTPLDLATEKDSNATILALLFRARALNKPELDHSNSAGTEDTELLDVPFEVSDLKNDDVSSIGTGGASVLYKQVQRNLISPLNTSRPSRPRPYMHQKVHL